MKKDTDPKAGSGKESLEAYLNSEEFTKALGEQIETAVAAKFDATFNRALTRQLKPALEKVHADLSNTLATKVEETLEKLKAELGDGSDGQGKGKEGDGEAGDKGAGARTPQVNAEIRSLKESQTKLQKDLEAERTKREAVEEQALADRKISLLTSAAQKNNAVDPTVVVKAVEDDVYYDEESKSFVAKQVNDAGAEEVVPATEFVRTYLEGKDFLIKSSGGDGSGSRTGDSTGGAGAKTLSPGDFTSQEAYDAAVKEGKIHGVTAEEA